MADGTEMASDLIRSRVRIEILDRLQTGEATRYTLRDDLDCARTTVDRNLDRLVEAGWIVETEGEYAITTAGELVLERAQAFVETVSVASRLQPILRWLPREELDVDVRHFADATVTVADEGQPIAMVDRHTRAVKRASNARMVLPVVSPQGLQAQYEHNDVAELDVEIVVTPTVREVLTSDPEFADVIGEFRAAGALDVYVTEEPIPFYLGLLDGTVQIGVDDDGHPRGLLESRDQHVREWATRRFERFRRDAVPLETSQEEG